MLENLLADSVAAFKRGSLEESEKLLKAAIALAPGHPVALYLLGRIGMQRRDWFSAEQFFRRALKESPGHAEICVNLAHVLRAQFRPAEAIGYCEMALNADPGDVAAALELAKAQEETGQTAHAESVYRGILARRDEPAATLNLARLLAKSGRATEAECLLRQALAGDVVG